MLNYLEAFEIINSILPATVAMVMAVVVYSMGARGE